MECYALLCILLIILANKLIDNFWKHPSITSKKENFNRQANYPTDKIVILGTSVIDGNLTCEQLKQYYSIAIHITSSG